MVLTPRSSQASRKIDKIPLSSQHVDFEKHTGFPDEGRSPNDPPPGADEGREQELHLFTKKYKGGLVCLEQGSAYCSLGTKSSLPPALLKLYWNTAMPLNLHIVYGSFEATIADLSCDKDRVACKA